MSEKNVMCDVYAVARGEHAPAGTEAEYLREALAWAEYTAKPGESPSEALERLILERSPIVTVIYQAAERAAQHETRK